MTTITKERLQEVIDGDILFTDEQRELARIALASMDAEPVSVNDDMAYAFHHALSDSSLGADEVEDIKTGLRAAFANVTAQPAPEVPDEYRHLSELYHAQEKRLFKLAQRIKGPSFDKYSHSPSQAIDVLEAAIFGDSEDACRAAMLQAEPVSNSDELPLDYLQGHKDGLEWAAQLAEANHPQTGDWLYDDPIDLARAIRKGPDMPTVQGGNSPVIPDDVRRMDWLVSKTVDVREPMVYGSHSLFWSQTITDEEDDYHATKLREQIDAAMAAEQAAAPQQEVKTALEHGMQRYAGAMQKLSEGDK
ncbi:hypothetical protein E7934_13440 [Salmonella enterica]|uniref:hypothetical protein n=1 Tax=Salmonella enterica TaxID=28901 RepID=UPI0005F2EBF9|nr:hypothetical protein [Salmonella enterica]ECM4919980.1 hypothetical protein [Salmonella enterica subsp. enterica serovar Heidelberg]EDW1661549.1 hypothetical protein [Salmonella enterica subsp. enterica serovar Typhimurium]KJU57537.1 hypothetical protein SEEH0318_03900 [Salmonella enterica subsp. enterica serovar Heidelberg str. 90-0318]QMP18344.1 hypothetical protein [Salmonella virus PAT1]QMP81888.1 EaA protein [Salmonella phage 65FD]QMP81930.1 EaA protein [Salmonella phage 66FD]